MPVRRGWSLRTQSRTSELKCLAAFGRLGEVMVMPFEGGGRAAGSQAERNVAAIGANCSWNWKIAPWPESG